MGWKNIICASGSDFTIRPISMEISSLFFWSLADHSHRSVPEPGSENSAHHPSSKPVVVACWLLDPTILLFLRRRSYRDFHSGESRVYSWMIVR